MRSNNSAAVAASEKARKQSAAQFERQMKLMERQMKQASRISMPAYEPPPPAATRSASDSVAAGRELRRASARRYGIQASRSPMLGGQPAAL